MDDEVGRGASFAFMIVVALVEVPAIPGAVTTVLSVASTSSLFIIRGRWRRSRRLLMRRMSDAIALAMLVGARTLVAPEEEEDDDEGLTKPGTVPVPDLEETAAAAEDASKRFCLRINSSLSPSDTLPDV